MKPFKLLLFFIGLLTSFQFTYAQNVTNEGSEFWVCFPDHVPSNGNLATMSLFITSKSNSSGVVSCGTYSESFTVQANTVKEIFVPRNFSFLGTGTKTSINKGIKVKVDDGKPKVVVYAHVFAGFRSAATLVLPYEALGRKHFAFSYDQQPSGNGAFSQFNVIAVEDNTKINITPVINGTLQAKFSVTLAKKGDVYQYQNPQDVTGSLIEVDSLTSGCKRIAAFSGSTALVLGTPTCDVLTSGQITLDPLLQQLYPIDSWGNVFSLVPFFNRNTGSIFRIIASENNTTVNVGGVNVVLNSGQFYTTAPITAVSIIKSDKPISVAQYALSQVCSDSRNLIPNGQPIVGDPDMVILNPLEYSIDKITLYSSSKLDITEQYLNITIPTSKASSFTINNNSFASSFNPIPNSPTYSYAQIQLNNLGGSNFSLAADTGFNAIAYGFGQVESYAYSAGTSLASTTIVTALKTGTSDAISTACIDGKFDFKLLLPYIPTKLVWKIDAAKPDIVQNSPTYTEVVVNNKVLYEFKLLANLQFATSGVKPIKITVSLPVNSGVCSTVDEEIINYSFEVIDLPDANFTAVDKVCITKPIQFNYVEKNIGATVKSWLWDFGDGKTSTLKDPSHTYAAIGIYKVKLLLQSELGCNSFAFEKSVEVIKPFVPNYEILSSLCANTNIAFVDKSTSTDGTKSWLWDFGDGTTSTLQNPAHLFTKSGTYNVSLLLTSNIGCTDLISKAIKIYDPAQINFADPGSCINDLVKFNAEVISGTVSSWLWDFGDGSNDIIEKVKQNPQHRYLSTGTYNVKLQATSTEGCVTTLTKTIKISGSNPKVSFDVLDKNNLCSNTEVSFRNTSTIVFGEIVKLEIIYENSTGTSPIVFTDNAPTFGKIYSHKYPASAVDKNYQMVFRAYSGQLCFQESPPVTITVNGSPQLQFTKVPNVCLNAPKFLLTAAKEINGIAGTTKFEGKGVSGNYFDPEIAGVGSHLITFTFISNKGCQDSIKSTITVVDIPKLEIGEDLNILLVGEKQLNPIIVGSQLKYKWTPSIGLSNDSIPNPIASPKETTKYTLTLTSKEGCMVADEVNVIVHVDPFIPNVFSPNNDGINDMWSIKYLETFVNATIKIFNRYGQQVFFAQQYNTPWDGKFKSNDVPVGVYYYIIEPNNGRNRYTGSVTLLR
ncbi:PKD domain-containing protein [Pedobacter alpinus]|uniref:PKD domain-containing protein n=1 Tax=Pedobacter alpinus TaxID=1590643 RepID=A0ABW5TSI4_9SPHI